MIWRRKHLPEHLREPFDRFSTVVERLEPAKHALTRVMPTTRIPGTSLPDALIEFETEVVGARELMPSWRIVEVEREWVACDDGLVESLDRARRLREEAPDLGGFEGLIWAVERLLDPLDPFEAAAARFRSLRVSGG